MSALFLVNDENFQSAVMASETPAMVMFTAEWCKWCKVAKPLVESIAVDFSGRLKVCLLDVDESCDTAREFKVRSIPTIALIKDGQVLLVTDTFDTKQDLLAFLADQLGL